VVVGWVFFIMKDGAQAARRVAEGTRMFTLTESLGGVKSLIEVSAVMTQVSTPGSLLEIGSGLVRRSVGLEHINYSLDDVKAP